MIPDFESATLEERQQFYFNAFLCIYCKAQTEFVSSLEVYQQDYGWLHLCRKCKAHVGCHAGSDKSMGTVATKPLRDLRHTAHQKFDSICAAKVLQGAKKRAAKAAGYNWLSKILGIDPVACHIGYFGIEECKKVIAACDKVYEDIAKKRELIKFYIDCVNYNSEEYGYEVKEFRMNGMIQLELTHKSGKVLNYQPKENIIKWSGLKSKWEKIDCIEKFIYKHFK